MLESKEIDRTYTFEIIHPYKNLFLQISRNKCYLKACREVILQNVKLAQEMLYV